MDNQGWKDPKTFHILAGNMDEIVKFHDEELLKDLALRNFDILGLESCLNMFCILKNMVPQLHHATFKVHNYKLFICS